MMKKILSIIQTALFLSLTIQLSGQTTPKLEVTPVENPGDIEHIVRNIIAGSGFDTIYGINFKGNFNGIGTFIYGGEIDIDSGVIISNGHVKSAEGYNVTGAQYLEQDQLIPDTLFGNGDDPDLARLLGTLAGSTKPIRVFDASVLSFYVRPFGDVISLKYIFASEEYEYYNAGAGKPDFVAIDSLKHDVFGIFFWAQPTNKKIISVVQGGPGDWYPVGLKYVSPPLNPNFGNIYEQNPPTPPFTPVYSIEFDAFAKNVDGNSALQTVIWDTLLQVTPCQTYGIKIAVADNWYLGEYNGNPYSTFFNSAVFLPAGGMIGSGSGLEWSLHFQNDNNEFTPKEMVEGGCSRMIVTLEKNQNMADTLWIAYKIQNADTSEYTITPTPKQDSLLWIPPHDNSFTFILEAKFDGIPEGANGREKWWFRYQEDPCDLPYSGWGTQHQGYSGIDTLYVYDYSPIVGGTTNLGPVPNTTYFCGNEIGMNAQGFFQGGVPPYFYSWIQDPPGNALGLGPDFTITISDNPDHTVCYARDRCTDFSIYQQALHHVYVHSELIAQACPDFQLCEGLEWPITIEETNVDQEFRVEWWCLDTLRSTEKIYIVTWDQYSWAQYIDPLVFDYIVTDSCGNTVTGHVDAYWDPVVDINGPDVICLGESITLTCTEGKEGFPYKWYKDFVSGINLIATTTVPELTLTPASAGPYTVCVEITNACDQIAWTCFPYEVSELICAVEMNSGGPFEVCPQTLFTLEELNGTSEWTWGWFDDGTSHSATGKSISLSLVTPGDHTFTVSAYNQHGCYDQISFPVNVFDYTQATATSELSAVCEGFPIWVRAGSAVPAASYLWTQDAGAPNISNPNIQQPTVAPLVPTTYTCLVTDENGCAGEASIFIDIREPIQGFISANPTLICNGQPAVIEFTGNTQPGISQYGWTFEGGSPSTGGNSQSHTVTWNSSGTYDITLHIDEPGCEADFQYSVTIEPLPVPMMTASNSKGCQPVTVQFTDKSENTIGPTYHWDFGDGATSGDMNPVHTYPNTGTYDVTLTIVNSTGCEQTAIFPDAVEVYPLPDAVFEAEPPAATLDNPKILFTSGTGGAGNNHTWDFGDGSPTSPDINPIHTFTSVGTFTILHTIENQYGCLDTDTLEVGISKELKIFIPNTFTPNGDGLNDCFAVSGTVSDIVDRFSVVISDKWGKIIYDNVITSYDCIWDGTGPDGKPLEGGEYVYVISGKDLQGKKHVYQGVLIILK